MDLTLKKLDIWIHEEHTRNGYATEVAAALTRVAFEIDKVGRVEVHCAVENYKSAGVPKKLGFTHEGNRRRITKDADGQVHDSMIWTTLKEEYGNSIPSKARIEAYNWRKNLVTNELCEIGMDLTNRCTCPPGCSLLRRSVVCGTVA